MLPVWEKSAQGGKTPGVAWQGVGEPLSSLPGAPEYTMSQGISRSVLPIRWLQPRWVQGPAVGALNLLH